MEHLRPFSLINLCALLRSESEARDRRTRSSLAAFGHTLYSTVHACPAMPRPLQGPHRQHWIFARLNETSNRACTTYHSLFDGPSPLPCCVRTIPSRYVQRLSCALEAGKQVLLCTLAGRHPALPRPYKPPGSHGGVYTNNDAQPVHLCQHGLEHMTPSTHPMVHHNLYPSPLSALSLPPGRGQIMELIQPSHGLPDASNLSHFTTSVSPQLVATALDAAPSRPELP